MNLEIIQYECFSDCPELKFVIAPKARTMDNAFHKCYKIQVIDTINHYDCTLDHCKFCPKCNNIYDLCIMRGKIDYPKNEQFKKEFNQCKKNSKTQFPKYFKNLMFKKETKLLFELFESVKSFSFEIGFE